MLLLARLFSTKVHEYDQWSENAGLMQKDFEMNSSSIHPRIFDGYRILADIVHEKCL